MTSSTKHIIVIGAGVIGLQTAVSLLEAGYKVTIVAKHFPGDFSIEYTSPWAGAHWRPHSGPKDLEEQEWDMESYNYWLSILARELNEPETTVRSGLGIYESVGYNASEVPPWFAKKVLSFKSLSPKSVFGQNMHGHTFNSIMINTPIYLQYLFDTSMELGATTVRATLPRSTSLAGSLRYLLDILSPSTAKIDAFVNATGISARQLVPDESVYPIRGQTITVKGEAKRITCIDACPSTPSPTSPNILYVLPRPHSNTTILGGTKQANNWTAEPNPQTTKEILNAAKEWAPELLNEKGEFEVISEQVGLRPGRKGGARVEVEEIRFPGGMGEAFVVCHSYGHAGAGYQNSIGSAKKVVGLFSMYFGHSAGKTKL